MDLHGDLFLNKACLSFHFTRGFRQANLYGRSMIVSVINSDIYLQRITVHKSLTRRGQLSRICTPGYELQFILLIRYQNALRK